MNSKKEKVVPAKQAVRMIKDGDTIATGGFVGIGFPEFLAINLEKRFLKEKTPQGLTLVYAAGQGDGQNRGLNHLGHEGLVKKVIGGHWGLVPKLQKLALENKIQAYNIPQGVITHLYRDIAAQKPRTITRVGLDTFVDPRRGGGKINSRTTEDLVELISFDGQEYLAYKTFPINVALLRGTTADLNGNISMEKEALVLEALAMATATKNSGGRVIVQVERIAQSGSLSRRAIKIPGIMVDCVVVAPPEHHWQTFAQPYDPSFSGEIKIPAQNMAPMELNPRKIIARRATLELKANSIVNLGIGMPEGVSNIANEEQLSELMTLTAEPGVIGGFPAGGLNFGAAVNTEVLIDQPAQFDFYDGGGLDIAYLGMAQCDAQGNVNVSRFGKKLAGAGGFINISQNAKKVVFVGTFTAGASLVISQGKLKIIKEGKQKFVKKVKEITFSGSYGLSRKQEIMYITERAAFKLNHNGLQLIEIAPGVDLERDILSQMGFRPIVSQPLPLMNQRIFLKGKMGIKPEIITSTIACNCKKQDFFYDSSGKDKKI